MTSRSLAPPGPAAVADCAAGEVTRRSLPGMWAWCALAAVAVAWSYRTTFAELAQRWAQIPDYSHGYLVPLFALVLAWSRRDRLDPAALRPAWWGLPLLVAAVGVRYAGARYYIEWLDFVSLIPLLGGVALCLAGWAALRWLWPAIGFLLFMMPLPFFLEIALRDPLRQLGTTVSTYALQTIGLPAFAEGNVIVIDDVRIGVVEACSGLRMLMIFFALSVAMALLSERAWWQRAVIVLSAIPIALIANAMRITVTGGLYGLEYHALADAVFHDLAGWMMMPLGLALLGAELWFLNRLVVLEEKRPPAPGLAGRNRLRAGPSDPPGAQRS